MKAVVAAFNQVKALVGAFSVITNLRMDLFEVLLVTGPGHCSNTTTTIGKNVQIFHFKETVNDWCADKIRATVIVTCKYHGISLK